MDNQRVSRQNRRSSLELNKVGKHCSTKEVYEEEEGLLQFATQDDIANAVRQQMTRFDAENAEADGIQHRWQRLVTVAGDYIEGL
ncbi:hypothetical protein TNCV_2392411 [Trichonephila clavipes]|nr:hypothetical protein TNCV_2392411 [Trichonephila clavipes]